jgi:polysaccharide biosynthesis transport protein
MAEINQQTVQLREYWQIISKRRWLLIMPTMIVPLAAVLMTFFMKPVFESSSSILLSESTILPPTVERQLEQGRQQIMAISDIQNAYSNQIRSTAYLKILIAKLDIPMPDYLKKLASDQAKMVPGVSEEELAENLLIESLRKQITVAMQGSNIIKISVTSDSPSMAKKMTQSLAEIFLEESLAHELAGLQGSISFTEEQLALYKDKLYEAEDRLRRYRQDMIASNAAEDTTSLNGNLNSLLSAVQALEVELGNADQDKRDLRFKLLSDKVDPASVNLPGNLDDLKNSLTTNTSNLADLLSRYNWRDAKVVALNQEAKNTLANIENGINTFVISSYSNLPTDVRGDLQRYLLADISSGFLQDKRLALEKSVGRVKSRLSRNPDVEVSLTRLQSEVNRYRDLYNQFVQHAQYAAIDQSAKKVEAQSKYMVVQQAVLPFSPTSPNRHKMLGLGIILGIIMGAGAILIIELIDDSYKTVEQVQNSLGMIVLATIPRIGTPYAIKNKNRGLIYSSATISLILIIAILIMKFRNG